MEMAEFALVLTTFPADSDVAVLSETLVKEHLAACVSVLPPMESIYRWKGALEKASERQLLIKTRLANVASLEQRLRELHPYEVPEMLVLSVSQGSEPYLAWLRDSC